MECGGRDNEEVQNFLKQVFQWLQCFEYFNERKLLKKISILIDARSLIFKPVNLEYSET